MAKFRAAVLADGTLADGATRLVAGNPAAVKMVFNRVDSTDHGRVRQHRLHAVRRLEPCLDDRCANGADGANRT